MKREKGSIAIFVLVALLFMLAFLIISLASNVNKSKTVKEQFNIISGIYAYANGDKGAYEKAYSDLRKKNKQTMTASVENSSTLELTKTFDENISNYKIYGNSVQNGTPTIDNPVEIQSVGATTSNLYNPYEQELVLNGVNCKLEGDTITLNGTATATGGRMLFSYSKEEQKGVLSIKSGVTYTMVGYVENCQNDEFLRIYFTNIANANEMFNFPFRPNNNSYFSIQTATNDFEGRFGINVIAGQTYDNFKMKFAIYEGDLTNNIPAYEPYGKYKISVKESAKNIFNEQGISGAVVGNGTSEKIKNGWRVVGNYGAPSATKYANGWFRPGIKGGAVSIEAGKTITISADIKLNKLSENLTNNNNYTLIYLYGTTNTTSSVKHYLELNTVVRVQQSFTTTVSGEYYPLFTLNNNELEITNIQIEKGNIATDYEQYQKPITTNMYLNDSLRKVSNYADYIDFKTGKVVRNIGKIDSYNGETITTSWISSTGDLSTGATVYYVLDTPIEETVTLPQLKTFEDYTKIEVLTSVLPSKIEVEYMGYTLE